MSRPATGEPLLLSAPGRLTADAYESANGGGRGYFAQFDHGSGYLTMYCHMLGPSPLAIGQWADRGTIVGYMDSTGNVTGPHVHFVIGNTAKVRNDAAIMWKGFYWALDPAKYLVEVPPSGGMVTAEYDKLRKRQVFEVYSNDAIAKSQALLAAGSSASAKTQAEAVKQAAQKLIDQITAGHAAAEY